MTRAVGSRSCSNSNIWRPVDQAGQRARVGPGRRPFRTRRRRRDIAVAAFAASAAGVLVSANDHVTMKPIGRHRRQPINANLHPALFDRCVAARLDFQARSIGSGDARDITVTFAASARLSACRLSQAKNKPCAGPSRVVVGDTPFGRILKSLMLTGQRRQEIGSLEWAIELPGRRTKNKRPHIVPLSAPALALLGDGPAGHKFVFGKFSDWTRAKTDLDKRIAERRGKPLDPWRLHDLRRSFTTHIRDNGFALPHVAEAILNHVSGFKSGVAGVYGRSTCLPERRETLEQWGKYLKRLA